MHDVHVVDDSEQVAQGASHFLHELSEKMYPSMHDVHVVGFPLHVKQGDSHSSHSPHEVR